MLTQKRKLTDSKQQNGANSSSSQNTQIPDILSDVTGPQWEQADGNGGYHCWENYNSLNLLIPVKSVLKVVHVDSF